MKLFFQILFFFVVFISLNSCNRNHELSSNFSIGYNDVTNSHSLYYKREGIIKMEVHEFMENNEYIIVKSNHTREIYCIDKKQFSKSYGSEYPNPGIINVSGEEGAKKILKINKNIIWKKV